MNNSSQLIISTLGKRYQVYRKNLGLTQSEIAVKTGISVFTISSFEKGQGNGLSLTNLISLFDAIGQADQIADLLSDLPNTMTELFVRRSVAKNNNPAE
ncbi:MAG: helix-turn-helix domain-containing protein [Bacteroidales bacterium]|nr:helix-turn-helix domain-containing protein [Bacteroidales bacterium]